MTVRTESDRRYYRRFLLIGLVVVGFALWSLYDGVVKYPNQRERALAMEELERTGRGSEWHDYATERGWPTTYPGEPKSEIDIDMQYAMAALAGAIGLWLLFGVWRSRGQWIEASDSGLLSSWGQGFDFDQMISLDKSRWRNKGIAKITYQDGNRRKRFVLDDFKFERQSAGQILREVEALLGSERITGGPPEVPPEEQGEEADRHFIGDTAG